MRVLVTGGAGFIGSHLCDELEARGDEVWCLDNLYLGREANICHLLGGDRFHFCKTDLLDRAKLDGVFAEARPEMVYHLAANSDISLGNTDRSLDLRLTFQTTVEVLEAMQRHRVSRIFFASTSAVFGDTPELLKEETGPLRPVSFYGASKLSAEAYLSVYAQSFAYRTWILRFPNVVGERCTHGAVHDFIQRLRKDPGQLNVLGDGSQTKPYLYVKDLVRAILTVCGAAPEQLAVYHVAGEGLTSVKQIAEIILEEMELGKTPINYGGGKIGWVGDVPYFNYDSSKIKALGFTHRYDSTAAVRVAVRRILGKEQQVTQTLKQVVVLCGGKGTRMGSLGENIPKALVPLAGKPLLEDQLDLAHRYGFEEILLLTGHLGECIESHFGSGGYRGMKLRYFCEKTPLGTAGALKTIEEHLQDDFIAFYGDTIMGIDLDRLAAFHVENQAAATLVVHPNHHPYDSDLLDVDAAARVVALYPKPRDPAELHRNLANAGLYVLSRRLLNYAPAGTKSDLDRFVLPTAFRNGEKIMAYNTTEYITDMGTPERLQSVETDVLSGKVARLNRSNPRPAVFLDRDGVLNVDDDRAVTAEKMNLLPGVAEAVRRINRSEYLAVVVTNQPAIAKGFISEADLAAAHARLETLLGAEHAYVDRIYHCPHHPEKGFDGERPELKIDCTCRKPLPGMLLAAAADLNIDLARSVMIGDRTVDVQAGAEAGCKTVLVRTGTGGTDQRYPAKPDFVCNDLAEAVALVFDGHAQK